MDRIEGSLEVAAYVELEQEHGFALLEAVFPSAAVVNSSVGLEGLEEKLDETAAMNAYNLFGPLARPHAWICTVEEK